MQIQKSQKTVAEQIKQKIAQYTLIEEKKLKNLTAKQKGKQKTLDEWNVRIPPQISIEKTSFSTPSDTSEGDLSFNQQLNQFLQSIISQKQQKPLMRRLFYRAETQPVKNLWHTQYANKLSFAAHLLTLSRQISTKQVKSTKNQQKIIEQKSQNENVNLSNVSSEQQGDENQPKNKKKRHLKKNNKKVEFSPSQNKKSSSFSQQKNISTSKNNKKTQIQEPMIDQNTLLKNQSKIMIEEINFEIDRVQALYFNQMQQFHTLPYVQVQTTLQNNSKLAKNQNKSDNGKTENQNNYPFQDGTQKINPKVSNSIYPLTTLYNQRPQNSLMNDMNYSGQYFALGGMNGPISGFSMPMMQMDGSLAQMGSSLAQKGHQMGQISQQMGHFGHQGMISNQIFNNGGYQGNGFYDLMMNMSNFGQQNSPHQSVPRSQGNVISNSSVKKTVMIENIEQVQ